MKINFGVTSWSDLAVMEYSIRKKGARTSEHIKRYREEIQEKLMAGLASAIKRELQRVELAGEKTPGAVTLSIDLEIEPYDTAMPEKYGVMTELNRVMDKRAADARKKNLLEW